MLLSQTENRRQICICALQETYSIDFPLQPRTLFARMDPSANAEVRNISVADYVVQCLVDCGVTHVFGGHGGAIVPLINSLVNHPNQVSHRILGDFFLALGDSIQSWESVLNDVLTRCALDRGGGYPTLLVKDMHKIPIFLTQISFSRLYVCETI